MRTSRTNGTTTYNYVYNGSQLTQMTVGTDTLCFTYDASGIPTTVTLNGVVYYYITNMQGDVVGIYTADGTSVCYYNYDAWGRPVTVTNDDNYTIDDLNPLRYRGYVFDQDTGLYYLQSRYYNPEWGRFINADSFVSTGQGILGNNMFAYCNNNPTNLYDKSGKMPDTLAGWIGEKIGEFFFECITGDDHPNKEAETLNNRIRQKQLQSAKKGAETAWDNYMRWTNLQQETQRNETQMAMDLFDTPETASKTLGAVGAELVFIGCFWGSQLLNPIGSGMLVIAAIVAFAS